MSGFWSIPIQTISILFNTAFRRPKNLEYMRKSPLYSWLLIKGVDVPAADTSSSYLRSHLLALLLCTVLATRSLMCALI